MQRRAPGRDTAMMRDDSPEQYHAEEGSLRGQRSNCRKALGRIISIKASVPGGGMLPFGRGNP